MIMGARPCQGMPVYHVKWHDVPHSHNTEGDIQGPAEFLVTNSNEMKGHTIELQNTGWKEGTVVEFDAKKKCHVIEFKDKKTERIDLLKPDRTSLGAECVMLESPNYSPHGVISNRANCRIEINSCRDGDHRGGVCL